MSEGGKYALVGVVAAVVIVLDQLTKLWVASTMRLHQTITIFSWFDLTYVRNPGAAFSLFADHSSAFRVPFFTLVFVLAGGAIAFFVRQTPASQKSVLVACGLVLGGAIGNLIDRVAYGEVIDFALAHWKDYYWPAFNVADSGISVGVVVLLLRGVFVRDEQEAERRAAA
ncbi:signal peptidase II [Candidatus Binatia bacterium]|jgi:signal peptidase II|nr:signal peptidase II [Candidatus Binatia bacterium]